MWRKGMICVLAGLLLWASTGYAVELSSEQQSAKERGITLYNQYKAISATPFLEVAAEAGDREAQFYLGEALRQNNFFMTSEARQWLEAAANQGYVYAMIRLVRSGANLCAVAGNCPQGSKTPGEWWQQAHDLALSLTEQGDPEAMFQMYKITGDTDWLVKAAEAGHAQSQYMYASFINDGLGFYWWPGSRQQAVEKWYQASAEGGYPPGMQRYAGILSQRNDHEGQRYWLRKAAEKGYASSVFNYAWTYIERYQEQNNEEDLIKAYGLISLLLELDGGGSPNQGVAKWELAEIAEQTHITPEQIAQAQVFASEWKASHPPLSFFPEILHPFDN